MKTTKMLMLAALGAVLASCGGKSGGKPNFADNEYAVRTVATEGTELQTTILQPSRVFRMFRFVQKYLDSLLRFACTRVRP